MAAVNSSYGKGGNLPPDIFIYRRYNADYFTPGVGHFNFYSVIHLK
eukprot:COSAG01_NODE_2218_length_8146_cov_7.810015_5_plen_46_part_00